MKRAITISIFAILAVTSMFFFTGKSTYNSLVEQEEVIQAKWSQVINQYQRRADLIPNLVNTVKGNAEFEKSTLTNLTEARNRVVQLKVDENSLKNPAAIQQFMQMQQQLSTQYQAFRMQVENYPDLKASGSFNRLFVELEGCENRIAVARMDFNKSVENYNKEVRQFPTNILAGILGFEKAEYYKGTTNNQATPEVKF